MIGEALSILSIIKNMIVKKNNLTSIFINIAEKWVVTVIIVSLICVIIKIFIHSKKIYDLNMEEEGIDIKTRILASILELLSMLADDIRSILLELMS